MERAEKEHKKNKKKVFKEIYDNLGGEIRIIVSAAAPIDPKVGQWIDDIGIKLLQKYTNILKKQKRKRKISYFLFEISYF